MLLDLDEAVLACKSTQARQYIAEVVSAYKVGAYRSAIVSTWSALIFDFIDKLRELDSAGDLRAKSILEQVTDFQGRMDKQAIEKSLAFEGSYLDCACDQMELISQIQKTDLERLREDRNRCAHPSLQPDDSPYKPSAELARYHMANALTHSLTQSPVQGKAALERLFAEVQSSLFPTKTEEAMIYFRSGPLSSASHGLVRNFIVATLRLVHADASPSKRQRGRTAILAVREMHTGWTDDAVKEKISDVVRTTPDDDLYFALVFIKMYPSAIEWLDNANRMRLKRFVSTPPSDQIGKVCHIALGISEFKTAGEKQLTNLSDEALTKRLRSQPIEPMVAEAVRRYCEASGFPLANSHGQSMIASTVHALTLHQVVAIRNAIISNPQLLGSTKAPQVIQAILQLKLEYDEEEVQNWKRFYISFKDSPMSFGAETVGATLAHRFPEAAAAFTTDNLVETA